MSMTLCLSVWLTDWLTDSLTPSLIHTLITRVLPTITTTTITKTQWQQQQQQRDFYSLASSRPNVFVSFSSQIVDINIIQLLHILPLSTNHNKTPFNVPPVRRQHDLPPQQSASKYPKSAIPTSEKYPESSISREEEEHSCSAIRTAQRKGRPIKIRSYWVISDTRHQKAYSQPQTS